MTKSEKLEDIRRRMAEARNLSETSLEIEGAHAKADKLLMETIQVLMVGTSYGVVVSDILGHYTHPSFKKWYA